MSRQTVLFAAAAVCAVGAAAVVGAGESSPLIWMVALTGIAVCLGGGAAGRPAPMFAGAAVLVGAYGTTLATGSSDAVDSLVFALLLWLTVELNMRSMELRRSVVPTGPATVSWLVGVGVVAGSTALLWLVVSAIESSAPAGGILSRVLAIGAVVAVAAMVSGLPRGRKDRALPG